MLNRLEISLDFNYLSFKIFSFIFHSVLIINIILDNYKVLHGTYKIKCNKFVKSRQK